MSRKRDPVTTYLTRYSKAKMACLERHLHRVGLKSAKVRRSPDGKYVDVFVQSLRERRLADWDARVARAEKSCKVG